jgi:hypothetical protein
MDLNYPRNIDLKKTNHPDLVGRKGRMKEIGEQVIVPKLSLPRDLTATLARGRRMKRRIKMERMIILWSTGIPRMIPRIHRIGTFPSSFLVLTP